MTNAQADKIKCGDLDCLLSTSSDDDLEILTGYILNTRTERLTSHADYKLHHPKHSRYAGLIADEIRAFGGNSIANFFRGEGAVYEKVVSDVCRKMKISASGDVVEKEKALLLNVFKTAWDNLSIDERNLFFQDIRYAGYKGDLPMPSLGTEAFLKALAIIPSATYMVTSIIAAAVAKPTIIRYLIATGGVMAPRTLGVLTGPVGLAITGLWTAIDLSGPAFRVTVPCVIHVAHLRQKYLYDNMKRT